MKKQLQYKTILATGVIFRLLIFITLVFFPISHNAFGYIGPLFYQTFTDLMFYSQFGEYLDYWNYFEIKKFIQDYKNVLFFKFESIQNRYPGFIFPLLIKITFYKMNFTILMALTIFFVELFSFYLWSKYFYKKINSFCALIFCFLPIPLIFGFIHSVDIIFYLFSSIIYLHIVKFIKLQNRTMVIVLIILVFTRPSAIVILTLYLIVSFYNKEMVTMKIFISGTLLLCFLYYIPYFVYESKMIGDEFKFIDINNDNFLIIIKKIILKLFYLLGLSESSSGNQKIILMRGITAIIFSLGYFYSFFNKKYIDILYINLIIIPVIFFLYPAWRYLLPVTPILYMYFFKIFFDINYILIPSRK